MLLLLTMPALAHEVGGGTVYYFRDGQSVPVERGVVLTGESGPDASVLLNALLAGPTQEEKDAGLYSHLPPDARLAMATTQGDEITVGLILPPDFPLDTVVTDAIVDQIAKTRHQRGKC